MKAGNQSRLSSKDNLVIAISISHFRSSVILIAILFHPSFETLIDVLLLQFNCNLNATAPDNSQPLLQLWASGFNLLHTSANSAK